MGPQNEISNIDLRDAFFDEVYLLAKNDPDLIFLTVDMGAFSLERFKKDIPEQFINVGVSEQNIINIASGLALDGKKVFVYGIIPFITFRCFEQIKVNLSALNLPVTIVGIGAGVTYGSDGPTHHATQDIAAMRALPGLTILNPSDSIMTSALAKKAYNSKGPQYIRVERGKAPLLYDAEADFSTGIGTIKNGSDLTIVSTGMMVHRAVEAAQQLGKKSINAGVIDLFRLKPVNKKMLLEILSRSKKIVTLEENSIIGGLGSIVCETLSDNQLDVPLKRLALDDNHCYDYGDREWILKQNGLDVESIVSTILDWI